MLRVLIILGLLCCCLPAHAADAAGVIFPETTYDFGTVKQGSKVVHRFAVENSAGTPLTIKGVQFSVPGMTARFRPVVESGSEGAITVEWDTSHVSGEIDGQANVLLGESPEQQKTLSLKAVVLRPLEILPYPAIFMSAFKGEGKEIRLKIVNHEEAPIAISLSATASMHFTVSLTTIESGKVYELVTRIPSQALAGRYDEELHLSTNNPKLADLTIPVHVFVKPDLYANPETLDFGAVSAEDLRKSPAARELVTQTFLVKARTGEFEITKIVSNLDGIEARKDPPQGKSSTYRIDVGLNPQTVRPGKLGGYIRIETDDRNIPLITVPITGRVF